MKTLGGRQFWGDVCFFHGWRIQQNIYTKHYRLLDEFDHRHASGTLEVCREALQRIRQDRQLPPMTGKGVILLHGIIRSSKAMSRAHRQLREHGYIPIGLDYPSTRVSIAESAAYLRQVVDGLTELDEIHFIVHSLGGLVTRTLLQECRDPRIKRLVMLGVPNHGANLANILRNNILFRAIFGPAGQQLVQDPAGVIASLAAPWCEFGIIAGARNHDSGYNPLIEGDDDLIVPLTSTRLPGARDFITVRCLHSFLASHDPAIEYAIRFLNHGHFREDGCCEPIPLP